jgi:hypothetical protein
MIQVGQHGFSSIDRLLRHGLLREFMLLSRNAVKAFQGENL